MSHIRDEEEGFADALREVVEIGRQAKIPVHVSHLKLGNKRVWGRTAEVLDILQTAAREGIDLTADCYPYTAWSSSLSILVPSRKFEDRAEIADAFDKVGGAQNVLITRYEADPSFEFKTMEAIAQQKNTTPIDLFLGIMKNGGANIVCHSMNQADVDTFYRAPMVMVASDGGIDSRHPRKAGTFTRVLGRLVREGYKADLVIFDPQKVVDHANFQQPDRLSEGISLVLVNGVAVWNNGSVTGELSGVVLTGSGLRPRSPR